MSRNHSSHSNASREAQIRGLADKYAGRPDLLDGFIRKVLNRMDEANKLAGDSAFKRTALNRAYENATTAKEAEFYDAADAVLKVYGYVNQDHDAECACGLCRLRRAAYREQ